MSARLMWSEARGWGRKWRLLREFDTEQEAKAEAVRLSGSANPRAIASEGGSSRAFEYQVGDQAWLVEVFD